MANAKEKKELKKEIKKTYKRITALADYARTLGKNDISRRMGAIDEIEWAWHDLYEFCNLLKN